MGPSPGIQAGGAFIPGQVAFKTVTRKPGRGGGSRAGEAVAGWGGRGRSGHRPFLLRPRAVPPRPPAPPPGAGALVPRAGEWGKGRGDSVRRPNSRFRRQRYQEGRSARPACVR